MKIENGYLVFENETISFKKVTGSHFGALNGLDRFKKKGDVALQLMGMIVDEQLTEEVVEVSEEDKKMNYYLRRGDIAEHLIISKYNKKGIETLTFKKKDVNYDNFQDIKGFGGLTDIQLPTEKAVIECKSKEMNKYDSIIKWGVSTEEIQGEYYAHLLNWDTFITEWVFFTEEQAQQVKDRVKITSYNGMKNHTKTQNVDHDKINKMMDNCKTYLNTIFKERRINLDHISSDCLALLGLNEGVSLLPDNEDTPF
ncbi:MAG: hypothetical protein R3Y05_01465 [bacterium]